MRFDETMYPEHDPPRKKKDSHVKILFSFVVAAVVIWLFVFLAFRAWDSEMGVAVQNASGRKAK
jgi:hypothetical protein